MKVLVYGSKGWIGQQFINILEQSNINYVEGKSRVDNNNELVEEINNTNPTHIISFIGRTHGQINGQIYKTIDYLEQENKLIENIRDNLYSPISLAFICQKKNIHLTYLGTGCIFEFDEEHPYGKEWNGFTEDSKPNFFGSSYSVVKGFTDELMHLLEDSTLNVRIRMPITDDLNKRNFITKITTYEKVCSIPNSMTVLDELIPVMVDMACNKRTGTVNLTNPGLISHNEILEMYKEIVDPDFTWKNFTVEEQADILAAGRSNNYLETEKLESLYPEVRNIKDSIRETLVRMRDKL